MINELTYFVLNSKMNLENIIVIGVCLAAIAIAAFYFYNKYSSQRRDLIDLSKRCETIEMILTKPPSQIDLSNVYNRKKSTFEQQEQPIFQSPNQKMDSYENTASRSGGSAFPQPSLLIPEKCEIEGLCDLQPLMIETNEAEIDEIVADEIKVITQIPKKSPPKYKNQHQAKQES